MVNNLETIRKRGSGKFRSTANPTILDALSANFAARGVIWSIPSSGATGAEARKVRAGDSIAMDPSGGRLIVQSQDSLQLRRFSVPLDGGPEREIPIDASITSAPIQMSPMPWTLGADCWQR